MANEDFITRRGTVYEVLPEMTFQSGFSKREFILEVSSQGKDGMPYKDFLKMETTRSANGKNDWISMLNAISKGDVVDVRFTLGGRMYTPKTGGDERNIVYLRCWDVKVVEKSGEALSFNKEEEQVPDFAFEATDTDDLPF